MRHHKYNNENYKIAQEKSLTKRFGPKELHTKICERCHNPFTFHGRSKTKSFQRVRFCSRSCANNRQDWWNTNATHYRTIAFQHHKKECAICGFSKIVAIHHIDENRSNNSPSNLIPLCPNHHEMSHSKWKSDMTPLIMDYIHKWRIGESNS